MPFPKAAKITRGILKMLPIPVGILASAFLVMGASEAAFSGSSTNEGNRWKAGSIRLGDSGSDSVAGNSLFTNKLIGPGYEESKCVTVISHSDIPTRTKMYGVNVTDNPFSKTMTISIEKGSISPDHFMDSSCESFHDSEMIYRSDLASFGRDSSNYSNGISQNETGDLLLAGGTATYRITLHLPESADNSVADSQAGATFRWEAQG